MTVFMTTGYFSEGGGGITMTTHFIHVAGAHRLTEEVVKRCIEEAERKVGGRVFVLNIVKLEVTA